MSLYKRGSVWHYDFAVDGVRFRGSTKESTLSRARTVESLLIAEAREKGQTILNRRIPLLSEFAIRFFEWVDASSLESKTKLYYRGGWQLLASTRLRGVRLNRINRDEVESIKFPGSASNAKGAIRTLRRLLGKAEEWKVISSAPKLKLAKEYGRSAVLDADAEKRLLTVASQPLRDVVIVMLDTGMRPQEVFCMRWEDIDWEKLTIFVPKGKTRNARRHVAISQRLLGVLKRRCNGLTAGWVFPSDSKTGHLTTVKTAFTRARRLAGLDSSVVLYTARHTFATNTLAATGNLALLMRAMGHSNAQTAMIYQHPSLELVREAVDSRNLALERHKHVTVQ